MPFFCASAISALHSSHVTHRSKATAFAITALHGACAFRSIGIDRSGAQERAAEFNFLGLQRGITDLGETCPCKKLKRRVEGPLRSLFHPGQCFGAVFGLPHQAAELGNHWRGRITKMRVVVTDKDGNDSIAIRLGCAPTLGYDHR